MSDNQKRGKCSHIIIIMAATDPPHAVRALQDLRCYRQAVQRMLRSDDGAATSGRQGTCAALSVFLNWSIHLGVLELVHPSRCS